MKQQTEIVVEIDREGNPKVEVKGHVGPGCKELTKQIELALGAAESENKKPEFYRQEVKHVATNRR
jgi:hypothetical protein